MLVVKTGMGIGVEGEIGVRSKVKQSVLKRNESPPLVVKTFWVLFCATFWFYGFVLVAIIMRNASPK